MFFNKKGFILLQIQAYPIETKFIGEEIYYILNRTIRFLIGYLSSFKSLFILFFNY